jgi:hypothetical protein
MSRRIQQCQDLAAALWRATPGEPVEIGLDWTVFYASRELGVKIEARRATSEPISFCYYHSYIVEEMENRARRGVGFIDPETFLGCFWRFERY